MGVSVAGYMVLQFFTWNPWTLFSPLNWEVIPVWLRALSADPSIANLSMADFFFFFKGVFCPTPLLGLRRFLFPPGSSLLFPL